MIPRSIPALALLVATLALGITGCSSNATPESSVAGGPSASTTAEGVTALDWDIALSQCIRAKGVTDYPDPGPDGGRETTADGYPGLHEAAEKCEPEVSARLGARPAADYEKPDPAYAKAFEAVYACLHDSGYSIGMGENVDRVTEQVWKKCDPTDVIDHD